jgi:hypothetical protein
MPHHNTSGTPTTDADTAAQAFIARWQGVTASELSTSQSFIIQLCELLGAAPPHPTPEQDYMFERPITFAHGDGSTSAGRIDCYKRGHFVWESKKLKPGKAAEAGAPTKAFDDALLRARAQAENYARALPAAEGRPPFVVVVDVGHVIELYAEFTRSGATYTPFPDPRSHRVRLAQLADPAIRARLKALWTDPLSLDPARVSAKVTRQVAAELAELAKSLEAAGHAPQAVAAFLTRCLFSMFAEDVGLLPQTGPEGQGSFVHLLQIYREQPATLGQMLKVFWKSMDEGGFNAAIAADVLRFNGKLFKGAAADGYVLPLTTAQIDGLLRAAKANWQEVEPAIFGTLLERALDPTERHALGAHYTPRAYVERLVLPTVVEPLRADWADAQAAAHLLAQEADELNGPKDGKKREAQLEEARAELRRFHHRLCTTRVLDPACGSGNFLYVTLEHLKRLEGEVMNQLEQLGETQDKLALEGETVTLQQLRGIELNSRAAALAELVLWIGWLQWHVRTRGIGSVAEPVVHDYGNIENRDAVLAYDAMEPALDAGGKAITRWDGETMRKHPVTGEDVPDETAQVVQWRYVNPRMAEWPAADFIVGNPPFIGNKRMRGALGDGYVEALRRAWPDVPDSADFVMYWWSHAAALVAGEATSVSGLITTNSITQAFNRAVIEKSLMNGLRLGYAIADHPWIDSGNGAQVRVAMSVVDRRLGESGLELRSVVEQPLDDGAFDVGFDRLEGHVSADLAVGADTTAMRTLQANKGLACPGVQLSGQGFLVTGAEAEAMRKTSAAPLLKRYFTGRDLTQNMREQYVIDTFGLDENELRTRYPSAYQWLADRVRPEREHNPRETYRVNWWRHAETRSKFRGALAALCQFIVTSRTARHRVFQLVSAEALPETKVLIVALGDEFSLGVLQSEVHVAFANRVGGWLGVGNDSTYNHSDCFEKFPFPHEDTGLTPALADRIRSLAEQLDAHRKARQAAHEPVTLTGLYNVLDKLRRGEALSTKDKLLHEQGLVSVLQSLHDELDAAVLQAYGWSDLGPVPWSDEAARAAWLEALLERLVALNAKRAAEEAAGTVRWLRPEFQDPARRAAAAAPVPQQVGIEGLASKADAAAEAAQAAEEGEATDATATVAAAPAAQPWPPTLPEQVRAVAQLLEASAAPLPLAAIESAFKGKGPWKKGLPRILQTLEALGRAQPVGGGWRGPL